MGHVVLLGDSIFDNARYVPGGPAVLDHLRTALPAGWTASLLAVDGSVAADVPEQLTRLPADATHLVLSAGGNDALAQGHLLLRPEAVTVAEAAAQLGAVRDEFERGYRAVLRVVCGTGRPTAVCTVYDAVPGLGRADRTGLALFNEVILREAARAGVPVLDLRLICSEAADYSAVSPIEPSAAGGGKIARAVARLVAGHDFAAGGCRVYA